MAYNAAQERTTMNSVLLELSKLGISSATITICNMRLVANERKTVMYEGLDARKQ